MKSVFINEMRRSGRLTFGEAAEDELGDELAEVPGEEEVITDDPVNEGDLALDDNSDIEYDEEVVEEELEPTRIQTIDVISQVTAKFDQYMIDTQIDWDAFIVHGRITKAPNYKYVEDLYTILNKTFDEKKFRFVEIYNQLFDMMCDKNITKSLNVYGRENFGKPYIAEGLAFLLYELSVDWACVITRYFKENPQFNPDTPPEEDSWFKKFPGLNDMTYIAKLVVENKELKKLITSEKAKDLVNDDTKYNLSIQQEKKKPGLRGLGESLSYYAGIVNNDFGDITAGILDKLGVVAFISAKTQMPITERLNLINRLIQIAVAKIGPGQDANGQNPLMTSLELLDKSCTELIKNRSEARITLDSNEKQYPLFVTNNV